MQAGPSQAFAQAIMGEENGCISILRPERRVYAVGLWVYQQRLRCSKSTAWRRRSVQGSIKCAWWERLASL